MKRLVAFLMSVVFFLFVTGFKSEETVKIKQDSTDTATVSIKADVNVTLSKSDMAPTAEFTAILKKLDSRDSILEDFITMSSQYLQENTCNSPPDMYTYYDIYLGSGNTEKTLKNKARVDLIVHVSAIILFVCTLLWIIFNGRRLDLKSFLGWLIVWAIGSIFILWIEYIILIHSVVKDYTLLEELRRLSG